MDSIDMNIQPILALDLVIIAFALIPGLQKAYDSLIKRIEYYDEIVPNLKKELHDTFAKLLVSRLKTAKCVKRFVPTANFEMADIVFEANTWFNAFNSMAYKINMQLMEKYYNLNFAISEFCTVATKFDDYMYNFAQANNCSYDSELYKAKYHELASEKWVSARFEKIIRHVKESYIYDYDYDSYEDFELSSTFLKQVSEIWLFALDEYIQIENQKFDNSNVSFCVTIDEKEQKRDSYERRKKNAHAHNKRRKVPM
jgi:hypothetical protein